MCRRRASTRRMYRRMFVASLHEMRYFELERSRLPSAGVRSTEVRLGSEGSAPLGAANPPYPPLPPPEKQPSEPQGLIRVGSVNSTSLASDPPRQLADEMGGATSAGVEPKPQGSRRMVRTVSTRQSFRTTQRRIEARGPSAVRQQLLSDANWPVIHLRGHRHPSSASCWAVSHVQGTAVLSEHLSREPPLPNCCQESGEKARRNENKCEERVLTKVLCPRAI